MGELLAKSNSSYYPSFVQIHNDVRQALDEAQDIDTHLRPLASHFESMETTDFIEGRYLFKPMFHVIGLLYDHCRHYASASRIVVLLQEICNLVMKQASEHLEPMELFKGEVDEALIKIDETLESLRVFHHEYEQIREKMGNKWDFSPQLVFAKWDRFMERMNLIKQLFSTANTFLKLEKVEIGGVKGRALSAEILQIYEEFKEEFERFNNKTYNPLDPKNMVTPLSQVERTRLLSPSRPSSTTSNTSSAVSVTSIDGLLALPIKPLPIATVSKRCSS